MLSPALRSTQKLGAQLEMEERTTWLSPSSPSVTLLSLCAQSSASQSEESLLRRRLHLTFLASRGHVLCPPLSSEECSLKGEEQSYEREEHSLRGVAMTQGGA